MSADPIAALTAGTWISAGSFESMIRAEPAGSDLYAKLASGLEELNARLVAGPGNLEQIAAGDLDNLHQLIIGMERTRLTFELLMSVRNRVLEAYQEIMRMQV